MENGNRSRAVSFEDAVADSVPRIRHALEQAEANEKYLRDMLQEQREEITRMRRALSIFDPSYKHPNSSAKPKPKAANGAVRGISREKLAPIASAILQHSNSGKRNVSQSELIEQMPDVGQSRMSAGFRYLRAEGVLRKAGIEKGRVMWGVLDVAELHKFTEVS